MPRNIPYLFHLVVHGLNGTRVCGGHRPTRFWIPWRCRKGTRSIPRNGGGQMAAVPLPPTMAAPQLRQPGRPTRKALGSTRHSLRNRAMGGGRHVPELWAASHPCAGRFEPFPPSPTLTHQIGCPPTRVFFFQLWTPRGRGGVEWVSLPDPLLGLRPGSCGPPREAGVWPYFGAKRRFFLTPN